MSERFSQYHPLSKCLSKKYRIFAFSCKGIAVELCSNTLKFKKRSIDMTLPLQTCFFLSLFFVKNQQKSGSIPSCSYLSMHSFLDFPSIARCSISSFRILILSCISLSTAKHTFCTSLA